MSERCRECPARPGCVLLQLSEEKFQKLGGILEHRYYGRGKHILRQGERPRGVFVVRSGLARLSHIHDDGKRTTVGLAPPGSILGLVEVVTGCQALLSAKTLEDSEIEHMPREKFVPFVLDTPKLSMELLVRLCEEFQKLLEAFWRTASKISPRLRLLGTLQEVASHCGREMEGGGLLVDVPLTVQDLATHVGLSRQWTTKLLQELVSQDLVRRQEGRLLITSSGLKTETPC